jgi:hypothetical protein
MGPRLLRYAVRSAFDLILAEWDLDWAYTKRTNQSLFAVETHTLYEAAAIPERTPLLNQLPLEFGDAGDDRCDHAAVRRRRRAWSAPAR